mgnify:CR=1 FL=1
MSKRTLRILRGLPGSGKSTQIAKLQAWAASQSLPLVIVREPGGTPIGEEIRHLLKHHPANAVLMPEAELLLMNASRAQLVLEVIRPALLAGEIVLCDRFYDSTTAYQGYGRQLDLALVKADPTQHHELARLPAIKGKTWNHPALAGGKLLVRNAIEMACYDLSVPR